MLTEGTELLQLKTGPNRKRAWLGTNLALQRLRNAASATFLVYIVKTMFAYLAVISLEQRPFPYLDDFSMEGQSHSSPHGIEVFWLVRLAIEGDKPWYVTILFVYFLITPFISMVWLCALFRTMSLGQAMINASRRYNRNLALSGLYVVVLLLFLVLFGVAAYSVRMLPRIADNDRTQDLIAIAVLVAGALFTLFFYFLHDASMAALAQSEARMFDAVRTGFAKIRYRRRALSFLAWHACVAVLTFAGLLTAWYAHTYPGVNPVVILFISQALVLGRLTIRGYWLASLVSARN